MSPIALLGLAWMVSVALGIWVIAALLFLAELRERKSEKTRSLASGFAPTSFYLGAYRRHRDVLQGRGNEGNSTTVRPKPALLARFVTLTLGASGGTSKTSKRRAVQQ
jgi:hypothetical protein